MASFPSTFRSEFTDSDGSSYGSLSLSYKEHLNPESDTESRVHDAQGGHYLDLDVEFDLDDGLKKKAPSIVSSESSNTLILGSAALSDSKVSKDGDRSTYRLESPEQLIDEWRKPERKLSCGEKLTKFILLTFMFIFEFILVYFDSLLGFVLGAAYLWNEDITFGILTILFPVVAGIICSFRLCKLLKKHTNAYYDFKSKFCKILSKIPTLQPTIFSYYVFKTELRYYPLNLRYTPHVADLQQVSKCLNILQGIYEAIPQALLQTYIYLSILRGSFQIDGIPTCFIAIKISFSLIRMSQLCVRYWQTKTQFIFIPDSDQRQEYEVTKTETCFQHFWKKFGTYSLQLPYYLEGLTLSCLRVKVMIQALFLLTEYLESPLNMLIYEPKLLIPILTLTSILLVPRLAYSIVLWSRCIWSNKLDKQWEKYEIFKIEKEEQISEYFKKFLKRGLYSILVYPIYPTQFFLILYVNLEIIAVVLLTAYGDSKVTIPHHMLFLYLFTYYIFFLIRIVYEKLILSKPKSRYLLPQQIVQKCEEIIQKLESENPPSFQQMKRDILNFTEFYFQRVIGKNFVSSRGIQKYLDDKEQILEMFTLPWNFKSKNALIKDYPAKIGEDGQHLVLKKLPLWSFVNYFCCQVLVYYSVKHRHVFEKFELFQYLRRLEKFKTVQFNNMTEEEREVLLSFVEILQPLSFICLINFHTSPTFNYTAIQNFTHFEVSLGTTAVKDVDPEKLAYVLESVVAAKKRDWDLSNVNNLHFELPQEAEIEFEPLVYDNIPFMDVQL